MKIFFARTFAIALVLILTATGLWAGGGTEEEPAAAADKRYVTDPTTGKVVVAPEYGGTITFAVKLEPGHTDVLISAGAARGVDGVAEKVGMVNWGIDRDVYDIRAAFFYYPSASLLTGRLAESWETPDDTTIVLNIRQGVNWHDKAPMNGRELTADDVVYNYHRATGSGSGFTELPHYASTLAKTIPFESITATDDRTVVIKLTKPQPGALEIILTNNVAYILPPEVIKQKGDVKDWRNLVGTGPFMLTDWVDGSSMTWSKNPDYWGFDEKFPQNRLPYVDGLTGLIMKETATILAALRSGQLDYVGWIGAAEMIYNPEAESLQRTNPEIKLYEWSHRSENAMVFNMRRDNPFSKDVRVRRAMQMALDLETMNYTYFRGFAKWEPRGLVGEALTGYYTPFEEWPQEVQKGYMYDPAGAEALLDEAGYPRGADGTRLKTNLIAAASHDPDYEQLAVSYWDAIGIDVSIKLGEDSAWIAHVNELSYKDMIAFISGIEYTSPVSALSFAWSEGYNPSGLNDPEYERLYEAVLNATTTEEQQRAVKEADMWVTRNHIWVWSPAAPKFNAVQPWVAGFNGETSLGHDDRMVIFSRLWIDSELKKAMGR